MIKVQFPEEALPFFNSPPRLWPTQPPTTVTHPHKMGIRSSFSGVKVATRLHPIEKYTMVLRLTKDGMLYLTLHVKDTTVGSEMHHEVSNPMQQFVKTCFHSNKYAHNSKDTAGGDVF